MQAGYVVRLAADGKRAAHSRLVIFDAAVFRFSTPANLLSDAANYPRVRSYSRIPEHGIGVRDYEYDAPVRRIAYCIPEKVLHRARPNVKLRSGH